MDKTAWIVVSICVGLLGFHFYQQSKIPAPTQPPAEVQSAVVASSVPENGAAAPEAQATAEAAAPAEQEQIKTPPAPAMPVATPVEQLASLTTVNGKGEPVVRYVFQNVGGSIQYAEMLGAAINSTKEELQQNVRLNGNAFQGMGTLMFHVNEEQAPTFDQSVYNLVEATDKRVVLQGNVGNIIVRKEYSLKPLQGADGKDEEGKAYMLHLNVLVLNNTAQDLEAKNWAIYTGATSCISKAEAEHYTFYVAVDDGDFHKENAGHFKPWFSAEKPRIVKRDYKSLLWAGTMNQYYASLFFPAKDSQTNTLYSAPLKLAMPVTGDEKTAVEVGIGIPDFRLNASTAETPAIPRSFSYDIYTGPKLNLMLEDLAGEYRMIDRIMDYGWLTLISYPMNWLINIFHGWFGNWGLAIICMTLCVRILIWPLYRKSYMSMKRMSLLQPQMKELKEKYPNDTQKVNMEMMKLYKEYGISPMGGCLPMFLQIPIFFAFFYVLQTAAEFRGAPFFGWVTDLSQMDTVATIPVMGWELPINILPIIMAVTMLIQMRMTPAAGDPTQQKIMRLMPLFFFLFCYTYPSALALYWTTQNILSIGQTWIIQRMTPPTLTKVQPKKGAKKGFLQRMMEAQQKALEEQQRRAKSGK